MRSERTVEGYRTILEHGDVDSFHRLLRMVGPYVNLEPLRSGWRLGQARVWECIVSQVCVSGSALGMERLTAEPERFKEFKQATSLPALALGSFRASHLAAVLRRFKATRFHNQAAKRLLKVIRTPTVVQGDRCVLMGQVPRTDDYRTIREALLASCPIFKLKSASDFMISTGLCHDVVALDTRVVGVLQRNFGFNLEAAVVQGRPELYLSVEQALREVCDEAGESLARLDRILFQFSGGSTLEFVVERMVQGFEGQTRRRSGGGAVPRS